MLFRSNDSTSTLARFGRDQRTRTSSTTAERVERRPRLQREAGDADSAAQPARRASFNPNFTRDNRPVGETRERRSCGDKPRYGENDKPRYGAGKYTPRGEGGQPAEERRYGDKPRFGGNRSRFGGDKPRYGENDKPRYGAGKYTPRGESDQPAEERRYGDKPAYGAKKFGPKKFGEKKFGDKPRFGAPKREFRREEKPKSYPKYDPSKQIGEMRLNRFIAQSGLCSRREADDFISAGLVSVNGVIVTELGSKVMPTDEVKFNDSRVEGEKKVYLVLNKPKGYVTSLEDPHADKLVMDLIKGACTERIYPVGRLDKNSLGLLLFTNDGDLTKQLTHPAYKKKKIYQVTLDKPLTRADMDAIAEGITLEDGEIHADEVSYVKENKKEVGIEIHSGRNRIVRRIFESLGYTVQKLDRVYYAGLTKKNLKRGGWRFLTRDEVNRLKSGQYE